MLIILKKENQLIKYKDTYKKGYCYRCLHRYICKLTILICYAEYNKLIDTDKNNTIKYEVNSKQKTHACNSNTIKIEEVEKKEILTKEEEIQLAKMLIKANITESPSFHYDNLNNNNIKWKKKS